MKRIILTLVSIAAITTSTIAGPFKTAIYNENGAGETIDIPSGKAFSIVNFVPRNVNGGAAIVYATINNTTGILLFVGSKPTTIADVISRELVVDGPAVITVYVGSEQQCLMTYKIFAN
jgi:hypothetical protein